MKKKWPVLVLLCIIAISIGFYATWSQRIPEEVRRAAATIGVEPEIYNDLKKMLTRTADGQLSEEEFQRCLTYTEHESPDVRGRAYRVLANCDREPLRTRAIEAAQRMPEDSNEKIRNRYAYTLYQLNAPNWEEEYKKLLESPDPELRAEAERLVDR